MGFRSSQTHFASEFSEMVIVSAAWDESKAQDLVFDWQGQVQHINIYASL